MVKVKRIYDPLATDDGVRFLVDRLWPRGVKREALQLDGWPKGVGARDTEHNNAGALKGYLETKLGKR